MQQIKLRSNIGEDGILHVAVPSEFKGVEVSITITLEAIQNQENSLTEDQQKSNWAEFIARTAGALADDDSFFRHPQGEYEIRESLD